ncbi:hypothetical protein JHK85_045319 [Glycine max]|nr:hypothetical protein JHK86_044709 [Glycine max]KAG4951452.1 hypothetical protein JHK85_045319 [Glycine max]
MTNSSSSSTKEWFLWGVVVDLLHLRMVLWEEEEEEGAGAEVETMIWLQKLEDASLELKDIMDEHDYETLWLEYEEVKCCLPLPEMVQSSCLSSFHPIHAIFLLKLAKRMKSISERLDEIVEERKKFHFIETVHERKSGVIEERRSGVIKWNQTSSLIIEPKVYGREKDKDQILPNSLICLNAQQRLSFKGCSSLSSLPPKIGKLTYLKVLSMYIVGKEKGFLLAKLGAWELKENIYINNLGKVKSVTDAKKANMSSK